MQRIKYRISLDMLEVASQTTIKAKKGDTACSLVMTLTENGKIYHITDGCSAVISGKKSDGNYLFNGETCRIEDNTIIYYFTEQTVPIEGVVECEVILYKDNEQLTTPRFNILVGATVYDADAIVSTPEADALKEFIEESENRVNNIVEESENVIEEVGEVHRNSNQYFSNAIKGTATNIKDGQLVNDVVITDISPLEHNINVKVDNADAKVYRCGKNLFDQSLYPKYDKKGITIEYLPAEDCFLFNGTCTSSLGYEAMIKLKNYIFGNIGDKFSISAIYMGGDVNIPSGNARAYFGVAESLDDTSQTNWQDTPNFSTTTVKRENQSLTQNYISHFWFICSVGVTFTDYKVRIQLEKGTKATDYEKYVEFMEYTPNADGNLTVPSAYPTTILSTDTKGVTINAEYNRDANKVINNLINAVISLGGNL